MSMMLTFRAGKVVALALCLSIVTACSREQQDWRSAEASDTVESYGKFLQRHPDSELVNEARTRVAQLSEDQEWNQAGSADTPDAYRQFLARHPNGKWSQEARIRIQNFALNGLTAPTDPATSTATTEPAAPRTAPVNGSVAATTGLAPAAPGESASPSAAQAQAPAAKALASPGESAQRAIPTQSSFSTAYVSAPRNPDSQRQDFRSTSGVSGSNASANDDATGYGIQLGAFGSEAAANNAWQQLTARFGTELRGLVPRVIPANITGGSMLFRLQAQVPDEASARALCDVLRKQSQACVPILPH
jgi:hypothetical protein